jgi:hypothetical protein
MYLCSARILMLRADHHPTKHFLADGVLSMCRQRQLAYLKLLYLTDDLLIQDDLAIRRGARGG